MPGLPRYSRSVAFLCLQDGDHPDPVTHDGTNGCRARQVPLGQWKANQFGRVPQLRQVEASHLGASEEKGNDVLSGVELAFCGWNQSDIQTWRMT